jgi:hypothetical protein
LFHEKNLWKKTKKKKISFIHSLLTKCLIKTKKQQQAFFVSVVLGKKSLEEDKEEED